MKSETNKSVSSVETVRLLTHAVAGKSKAIESLRVSVWTNFDLVCDAVEENKTMRQMVIDYLATKALSKTRLTKLRNFLRQQTWLESTSDVENLAVQITIILEEDKSFLPKSLEWLAKIVDEFVDSFIQMYNYTPEDATWDGGGVAVATRRFRKRGEEAEDWEEDEEVSALDKKYVHVIRNICSHIDSYVRYLDARTNRAQPGAEYQAEIYTGEISNGRWDAFRRMTLSLKKILLNAQMMDFIEDTHYDTSNDIQGTSESINAYSILFDDHRTKG